MLLLGVSLWIRLRLSRKPDRSRRWSTRARAARSRWSTRSAKWGNLKIVLLALVGLTAGQAVVWYTGQFYALFFLEKMLKVDGGATNLLVADRPADRHAVLRVLRLAVGQDRPQADHHAGLYPGGPDLFPAVQDPDRRRQSAVGRRRGQRAGDRGGRPGRLLVPVRPRRQDGVQPLVRPGQVVPGQGRRHLRQPGRAGRLGGPGRDRRDDHRLVPWPDPGQDDLQGPQDGLGEGTGRGPEDRRLSGQGRSRSDQQAAGGRDPARSW